MGHPLMVKCLPIFFLVLLIPVSLLPQHQNIKFEHLTSENGLSDNSISCIIQDSKGFMWFGTGSGLNKYDGYKFTIYKNDPGDSLSLSSNIITALYGDHSGELWIGTMDGGLCRYDIDHDSFIRYRRKKNNPNSLCQDRITAIYETDQHDLWIGCGGGLNKYIREADNFIRYFPEENKEKLKINVNWIGSITQDYSGRMWIGTYNEGLFYFDAVNDRFIRYEVPPEYSEIFINQFITQIYASRWRGRNLLWAESSTNGLYKINLTNDKITQYKHHPNDSTSISDNEIFTIYQVEDNSDELWLGTLTGGLNRFDLGTEEFVHFRHLRGSQQSLSDDHVSAIFRDKTGMMWVGTTKGGLNKFDPTPRRFRTIQDYIGNPYDLSGDFVTSIHESNEGGNQSVLWIGTVKSGLKRLDRTSGLLSGYRHDPENVHSLSHNWVTGIIESRLGKRSVLWVSTMGGGLNKIDLRTKRITHYYIPHDDPIYKNMYSICKDQNGRLWIPTHSTYLYRFDPETKRFTRYNLFGKQIYALKIDAAGMLWLGGESGLYKLNTATREKTHYRHITGDISSFSNNKVWSIFEDRNGTLWIGTSDGLNKFDRSSEVFTHFEVKNGLPGNVVRAMLEDRKGNLWLSTNQGILKFDPDSKKFRNFNTADGLHDNEFSRSVSFTNDQGEMFFGGKNGLTYFHPENIQENNYMPPIVLTDFQIFNKSIEPGKNSPLKSQVSEARNITLSHDQSIFSLEFAALEFRQAQSIKYAYKMENVDPNWVFTDASRRFVTYTQLGAGEYVFRVKAANKDGIWNEPGTSVKITILPPWWRTWWAYTIYTLLFATALWGWRRYELNRQRLKHNLELEHLKAEKLKEVDRVKSRFFANISHEFRTPLTLIRGPIQQLISGKFKGNITEQYYLILRNTSRLLKLINQLLDISRLEAGKMKLQARPENFVELTRQLTMAFESLASVKDIELQFTGPGEAVMMYLEREHYEKIINNLLSNALKFTNSGGKVEVGIRISGSGDRSGRRHNASTKAVITVKDNGPGIPPDQLPHIFDRFYQADGSYVKDTQGSGIGLALTKELVELHHGTIKAFSEAGKGTEFIIQLPMGNEHLKPEEMVDDPATSKTEVDSIIPTHPEEIIDEMTVPPLNKEIGPPADATIALVVEDNPDMRSYIREFLVQFYQVIEAVDGKDGFEKAADLIPDIIISDVMMPEMDGFQFCEKIKTDERTSHIPVILLTAKSSGESKLEGLETGADDYLTKPFDTSELNARIKNLIEQRCKLRERYGKEITLEPQQIAITSADANFLQKIMDAIEQHIGEPEFKVAELAIEVGMSRSQLFRKLKALTDQTPLEFIHKIKLKRAAALLANHSGNISEIAYQVGFNNPAYFAECFRKLYGMPPSEYLTRAKL